MVHCFRHFCADGVGRAVQRHPIVLDLLNFIHSMNASVAKRFTSLPSQPKNVLQTMELHIDYE